ncbi:hypothetical protein KFE98_19540 [bacterium SCSIO 12741]|nr:hypothetical protein KFE98_19540 [bacterium SCSIO 12741]
MDSLKPFSIKSTLLLFAVIGLFQTSWAQGNCLLYPEGSGERKACELSYKAIEHRQGSIESQILFDSAITVGPNFAYAYCEKAVPYMKRGKIGEGMKLLNKAVELDPITYQCYRAYWYFSFHSYQACIEDVESYLAREGSYPQYSPGGEIGMKLILSICYAKTDSLQKAVLTAQEAIAELKSEEFAGTYDFYTLGVLLYQNGQFEEAETAFQKQVKLYDRLANSYYYLGLIKKEQKQMNEATAYFQTAQEKASGKQGYLGWSMYLPVSAEEIDEQL